MRRRTPSSSVLRLCSDISPHFSVPHFSFPDKAIDYCLQQAGASLEDLKYVVFYDKPLLKFERIVETYLALRREALSPL